MNVLNLLGDAVGVEIILVQICAWVTATQFQHFPDFKGSIMNNMS